jgi:hypothetical protein
MQKNGSLLIKIDAVSNWGFYAGGLMIVSGVFVYGLWMFAPLLLKVRTLTEALYCLVPVAFLLLWFIVGLRIILERLCSVELSVGSGIFRWRYKISRWRRDLEARQDDVTAVIAKARWYGNRLNVTMNGRTYSLSDILDDDLEIIARELRRVLPKVRGASDAHRSPM